MTRLLKTSASVTVLALFLASAPVSATDLKGSGSTFAGLANATADNPFQGFYGGLNAGGQFTNIDVMDQFDGIGADGLIGGAHAGYNACAGRICFGPYAEAGLSNANVEIVGQDALIQDWYAQAGLLVGYVAGKSTLISAHAGYDWSHWSSDFVDGDIDVGSIVVGAGLDTMIADHVSLGVKVDYLIFNSAEFESHDITDAVEKSEGLRVQGRLTYRH
jgi:opacity protein-like surface antigen